MACSLVLSLGIAACGDDDPSSPADASTSDAGAPDADAPDADGPDADAPDTGTGDADTPDAAPEMREVTLDFEARVGEALFDCVNTYDGIGNPARTVTYSDYRIYVSDVRLIDANGAEVEVALTQDGAYQYQNAALLDFENGEGMCKGDEATNGVIRGEVPVGTYQGVAFKIGLPPELNHSDTAQMPSPLDIQGLSWNWNTGRKFLNIDLTTASEGEEAGVSFLMHVGSMTCSGNAIAGEPVECARKNIAEIKLPDFALDSSKIVINAAKLTEDVALGGGGCQSMVRFSEDGAVILDPECVAIFPKLGLDPETGGSSSTPQTVFSVVAK